MEKTNQVPKQIIIYEEPQNAISESTINNFIRWRTQFKDSPTDELIVRLLFSHLKLNKEQLTVYELSELESLIEFLRDQKQLGEELKL